MEEVCFTEVKTSVERVEVESTDPVEFGGLQALEGAVRRHHLGAAVGFEILLYQTGLEGEPDHINTPLSDHINTPLSDHINTPPSDHINTPLSDWAGRIHAFRFLLCWNTRKSATPERPCYLWILTKNVY